MNGKWAEACALIILVCSKNRYVSVITEKNELPSQTLYSLKKNFFFHCRANKLRILCISREADVLSHLKES